MKVAEALVFSDLDGTLLDHESYSFDAARPALQKLAALKIPLVLASSKTASEVAPLRLELGFDHCEAIVENGCGVLEPHQHKPENGRTHPALLEALAALDPSLRAGFKSFSDWTADEVTHHTGLDPADAVRAKNRDFSEPGLWTGSDGELRKFLVALASHDITATPGGRFLTLSFGGNKAERLIEIRSRYRKSNGGLPACLALGDAPNDRDMLMAADFGVVIPNSARSVILEFPREAGCRITHARSSGPQGWNESVLEFLNSKELA